MDEKKSITVTKTTNLLYCAPNFVPELRHTINWPGTSQISKRLPERLN
jgi:hypothetical protein